MPYRGIQLVYKAFRKARRDNASGLEKEAFLAELERTGIDLDKVSIYRLAQVLKGELRFEDLPRRIVTLAEESEG